MKRTPGQPHPASPPPLVSHRHMSGPGAHPRAPGGEGTGSDPPAPSTAGRAGCYLPISLVVHGDEIHEEHVVSHGVHPEYLHLEGGEHAPGTERRERRAELRGSREPRGAGAGTRALPGPGVLRAGCGSPAAFPALPLQLPRCPVAMSGPLAGTVGRNGRKRQMGPGSVGRGTDRSCRVPQQHPEGRAGAALGSPASPAGSGTVCVGHPKCPAAAGRRDWSGERHHLPLRHAETQVKRISSPQFPHLSS